MFVLVQVFLLIQIFNRDPALLVLLRFVFVVNVACRTSAIFLRFQASGGECEASAEREREWRATDWTLFFFSRPDLVARDLRSTLASCFALAFALAFKTQKITPVLQAMVNVLTLLLYLTRSSPPFAKFSQGSAEDLAETGSGFLFCRQRHSSKQKSCLRLLFNWAHVHLKTKRVVWNSFKNKISWSIFCRLFRGQQIKSWPLIFLQQCRNNARLRSGAPNEKK